MLKVNEFYKNIIIYLYKVFIHLMGQGFCSYVISFYNNYKLVIFNNILKL